MLIGIMIPGMILSMPGISFSGNHLQSNNYKIMNEVFAQYGEYKYDNNYNKYTHNEYSYTDYKKTKNFAEIERFDDKLFVCDNGIVVDDRTQCPLKCPFGTTLEGAYVMDLEICDIEPGTASKKCPQGTDLEGVLVTNKNQCEIFSECDADSPLGLSLGGLEPIKVADVQLCQLSAPHILICDSGFYEGFAVDNQQICNTPIDNVDVCGPTTDLAGILTTDIQSCNLFTTCDANSPLGEALGNTPVDVVDPELCNLEIPEQTELFVCDLDTPMGNAIVTDPLLCQAPNDNNKCPAETDLEGVYVMNTDSDCNILATCDAGTALGKALGMQNEFKVADEVLCDLEIPEETELFQCIGGPMQGAIVTDEMLCQAPNIGNICPDNTDLEGVYVDDITTDCNFEEPLTQTITVNKTTVCDPEELGQEICDNIPDAKIMALGNNANPSFFLESQTPIDATLEDGPYSIMEKDFITEFERCIQEGEQFEAGRNLPQLGSNVFICSSPSEDCEGTAIGGSDDLLSCNMDNMVFGGDNTVYTVWEEGPVIEVTQSGPDVDPSDIFFAISTDGGQTFGDPINLSNNPSDSTDPRIAVSGDNVYIVWEDENENSDEEIFFVASDNNGQNFGGIQNISNSGFSSEDPFITAFNDSVYVVWENDDGNDQEIFFVASDNNGQNFGGIQNLSDDDFSSQNPSIAAFNDNVYVVWINFDGNDNEIFFVVSDDNGATFGSVIQNLSDDNLDSAEPAIATFNDNVYVVWINFDGNDNEIFFVVSDDNGATFGSVIQNLSDDNLDSAEPAIATFNDNVYVAWQDDDAVNSEVLFRASNNNGDVFDSAINLSNSNNVRSDDPKIAAVNGDVYVIWEEETSVGFVEDVLFSASNDNGMTFSDIINISDSGAGFDSDDPDVAAIP